MRKINVVSVVWNNRDALPRFLDSVVHQVVPGFEVEVVVVDNGSDDGSIEYLRSRSDILFIDSGVNAGFPAGMNRGVEASDGEYVVMCTDDLIFRPGTLAALADALDRDETLGGVAPLIETSPEGDHLYPVATRHPGVAYGWSFFSGLQSKFPNSKWAAVGLERDFDDFDRDLPWLHGCCGMYRRRALDSVGGGFDECFFMYFEDADLGRRLTEAEWRLRRIPEARIFHAEIHPNRQQRSPTRRFFVESWHRYVARYESWPVRQVAHVAVFFGLLLQVGAQALRRLLRRSHSYGVFSQYLRTHLRSWFGGIDYDRRAEIEAHKKAWNPIPKIEQAV